MIKITNEQVATEVMFKLGKTTNSFTEDELKLVEEIVIDPVDVLGNYTPINTKELNYFKNLKDITIRNKLIDKQVFDFLISRPHLLRLCFDRCYFEGTTDFENMPIKELEFFACELNDLSFVSKMNELKSLTIYGDNVSPKELESLSKDNLKITHI